MRLKNTNKKYTQIAIYVIITAIAIDVLKLFLGYTPAILVLIVDKLSWILSVVKPVILGFVFAYLLEPLVTFLERQFKKIKFLRKKTSCRNYAILSTLFLVLIAAVSIISLLVYSVTDQLKLANFDDFLILCDKYMKMFTDFTQNITSKLTQLNLESEELSDFVKQAGTYILNLIQNVSKNLLGSVSNISGYISTFIFALITTIYFLSDGNLIKSYLSKVSSALFSDKFNKRVRSIIADADMVFSGYIRGQLMDAFVMMVLISLALSIVGVKFALVIGVLAGIGNLIPYCGPFVAYIGSALVCLLNGQYKQLIIAVIVLFIIQTIDGNVIGPKLLSNSINIHPILIMISLIFGSAIGGLLGLLLAVPVGAFIKVLFVKFIDNRLEMKKKENMQT